jgi:hypothetical protein
MAQAIENEIVAKGGGGTIEPQIDGCQADYDELSVPSDLVALTMIRIFVGAPTGT